MSFRIAMLLDHPDRDLPGLVLTAVELCRQGAHCHLVPANLAWKEIWALDPDLVLFNYFRRSNEALGRSLAEAGIPFAVLDTEGGVWSNPSDYAELLWRDTALLHRAAVVCLWGERMAKYLVAGGSFRPDQIQITGCPRFDFYAAPWRAVMTNGHAQSPGRPRRVLINTNFSTRNPRFATVEQKIETSRRNFGWPDERIHELLRTEEEAIDGTIEIRRRLATDFPDAEILLRPHPFEDLAWYERALQSFRNVTISNAGPVQTAIFGAAVVVQRSCTTGIEAGLAATPTLSPQWIPAPWLMPMAEAVSVPCDSYADLSGHVAAILRGTYAWPDDVRQAVHDVTRDWFYAVDGVAHRRAASALLAALAAAPPRRRGQSVHYLYGHNEMGEPLRGAARWGGQVRRAFGLSPDWSFRTMRAMPALRWTETAKYFDADAAQAIADRVVRVRQSGGEQLPKVRAYQARDEGECQNDFFGHSVTLAAAQ